MKYIITQINEKKPSKHGGYYYRVFFKCLENEQTYILDAYEKHHTYKKWAPYLKEQAMFNIVNVLNGKYIDGYSPFIYLGQRHESE